MTRKLHSKEYTGSNHLMNPDTVITPAVATDLRATFARVRARMELEVEAAKAPINVREMRRKVR